MQEQLQCGSCKNRITNTTGVVEFLCPSCGKVVIIRCKKCRVLATPYSCPECGFTGPN
ncbi:MAG: zinc finger domain-containing protein [archaeon]